MKKFILPASIFCLLALVFITTTSLKIKSEETRSVKALNDVTDPIEVKTASAEATASFIYDSLNLGKLGLSEDVMVKAYAGQQLLAGQGKFSNTDLLTIVDFSQSSKKKRLYIIDVKNYKVLANTYVAHGKNTGLNYAEKFSNTPESLQSSLGFYVTKHTYFGKHGLSLRLGGLEKGFNDNAEARAIVMHGANYIGSHRLNSGYMGRSFGCPAVPQAESAQIIQMVKDGSCLFIYHPTAKYLNGSTVLNG